MTLIGLPSTLFPSSSTRRERGSNTIGDDVPAFYRTYFKCSTISLSGDEVVIVTKNLPPHPSNYYEKTSPNYAPFDTSRGSEYKANPNILLEQNVTLRIPVNLSRTRPAPCC